jgi:hypothetical protein
VIGTKAHTERDVRAQARDLRLEALLAAPEREQRKPAAGVKSRPPVQIATFAA